MYVIYNTPNLNIKTSKIEINVWKIYIMPTNNQKKVGVAILISDISVSDKEYYQKQRDSVPNNKSRDNAGIYLITKH